MIIVTVDLLSAIDGRRQRLGLMDIANDGTGTLTHGNYVGKTYRGRDAKTLECRNAITRMSRVNGYNRLQRHVWNLVAEMLYKGGYGGLSRLGRPDAAPEDLTAGLARYLETMPLTEHQTVILAAALQIIEEGLEGAEG